MSLVLTEEIIGRLQPEAQVIIRALLAENARLRARIEELEARLRKTPRNSSLPPGTQHPHSKPAPQRTRSGKKRGGQPGHPRHERPLIPPEQCTEVVPLKPDACRRCGAALSGNDPQPLRHQVWELPEIKPLILEYQRHSLPCSCCGTSTTARLPDGVPAGGSGPHYVALMGLFLSGCRQSKRRAAWLSETVFHVPCSAGLVVKLQNLMTSAVRPLYDELCAALPAQAVVNIDESPTKEGRAKAWLWTFVTPRFTVFAQRTSREAKLLDELLTDRFDGVIGCDRAKMYWRFDRLQWCWAHLRRDFQAMVDSGHRGAKQVGTGLLEQTGLLFRQWHRFVDGTITRSGLKQTLAPVRRGVEDLLHRGLRGAHAKTAGTCMELLQHRQWLWTFLDHAGVEPTNNASERALRPGVIWRKLSFGTQSAAGSRFVETMLSVIETCRQQSRDLLTLLTSAVERSFHGASSTPLVFDTA
jgi:transposase